MLNLPSVRLRWRESVSLGRFQNCNQPGMNNFRRHGVEDEFERRKFGATPGELHVLAQWLDQQGVEEVVMESTAQYWKPVWGMLERFWKPARQQRESAPKMAGTLHLCQAKSNHGPRGRKNDFLDGERMIK